MPLPVPHVDRPAVEGTLRSQQGPLADRRVAVVAFTGMPPATCAGGAETRTDEDGRFRIEADRGLLRIWWSDREHALGLCLPDRSDTLVWYRRLEHRELRGLPEQVRIDCVLHADGEGHCRLEPGQDRPASAAGPGPAALKHADGGASDFEG